MMQYRRQNLEISRFAKPSGTQQHLLPYFNDTVREGSASKPLSPFTNLAKGVSPKRQISPKMMTSFGRGNGSVGPSMTNMNAHLRSNPPRKETT